MSRPRLLYQCAKCGQLVHYQYCTEARVHFKCSAGGAVARQAANKAARKATHSETLNQTEKKTELLPFWSWVEFNLKSGIEGVFAIAQQPAKPAEPAEPVCAPFAVTPEE